MPGQNPNGNRPSLDGYVDVAERIAEFNKRYPDGTLQTVDWSVEHVDEQTFIVYRAAAYRTPDDIRPGHGTAWEPFPGRTPFTEDSELMNAETAAWGRAIVACGLSSRKIASLQEVQARQPSENGGNDGNGELSVVATVTPAAVAVAKPSNRPASAGQRAGLRDAAAKAGLSPSEFADMMKTALGVEPLPWSDEDAAGRWLKRNLDRLPARLVDTVLVAIESS